MISVEYLESEPYKYLKVKVQKAAPEEFIESGRHSAALTLTGNNILEIEDIIQIFNWTEDEVDLQVMDRTKILFLHILNAGIIYERDLFKEFLTRNKSVTLTFWPLEAWVPVESWLEKLTKYISNKNTKASIKIIDIQGVDEFRAKAHELFPNRR